MADKNRWIPLIAVILVFCLGATCLAGIVGGSYFLKQADDIEVGQLNPAPATPAIPKAGSGSDSSGSNEDAPPAPSFPPAAPGEQVLILPGGDPPTLDPHLSGDATSAAYVVEIFSGLVTYNRDLELVPDIAESWDVTAGGTVFTFHLRDNVKFHNGKPVRAQDFKWSMERACDFKTGSSTSDTYLGDVIGCRDKLRGRADEVAGIEALDDYTLKITIDTPKAYFLSKLTYPTAYVLDQENIERGGRTWTDNPNGTGPFKLEEISFGEAIVLQKNEAYYRDPQPQLDRINFSLTGGSAMIRYENDELDLTPVGLNDIERVTDPANPLSEDLLINTEISIFYLGMNVNQPPFDDRLVRRAFNYALNKEKIVNVVYKETVPVATGIVPPTMPGYSNPNLVTLTYDPDKALDLIAESSYGDVSELPEITLYTTGGGGSAARIDEAIVASYQEALGIEISIQQTDWSTFLVDLSQEDSPLQFFEVGWIADYPDPQNFLDVKFNTKSKQNYIGYGNPELDALLDEAALEQDPEKRVELYQEAEQIIIDDAPWVPLYYSTEYWLVKPHVKGFTGMPMIIPQFQYVYISE